MKCRTFAISKYDNRSIGVQTELEGLRQRVEEGDGKVVGSLREQVHLIVSDIVSNFSIDVVVVVLTLTRIIKSVVTGQAPITLE